MKTHTTKTFDAALATMRAHEAATSAPATLEADRYFHEMQAGIATRAPLAVCDLEAAMSFTGVDWTTKQWMSDLDILGRFAAEGDVEMVAHVFARACELRAPRRCIWSADFGSWFGGSLEQAQACAATRKAA